MKTSDWMKCNPMLLNKSITQIGMVGSHDSGTSTVLPTLGIIPFSLIPVERRKFMKKWCKTQQLSIKEQCIAGIRYFDFRVVYDKNLNDFYLLHGLYCKRVEEALIEINLFLKEHTGEIIIIDINHLYNVNTVLVFDELTNLIEKCCSKYLVLNDSNKFDIPIQQLIRIQQRLFVFCLNLFDSIPNYLFPQQDIISVWPNKDETNKMMKKLDENAELHQNNTSITVIQAVVTPSINSIRKSYYTEKYPNSTIKIAEKTNRVVLKWLQTTTTFINILLIDNVGMNDEIVLEMIKRNNVIEKQ